MVRVRFFFSEIQKLQKTPVQLKRQDHHQQIFSGWTKKQTRNIDGKPGVSA